MLRFRRAFFVTTALFVQSLYPQATPERTLCRMGFLEVTSIDVRDLTANRCRTLASQVMEAWRSDAARTGWANVSTLEKKPLEIHLLATERLNAGNRTFHAAAQSPDTLIVSENILSNSGATAILSRELAIIQPLRATHGRN